MRCSLHSTQDISSLSPRYLCRDLATILSVEPTICTSPQLDDPGGAFPASLSVGTWEQQYDNCTLLSNLALL